ncbi:hypothetical protein COCSUDRAFT_59565 [Coccomyxa subellipsoidea C-169]|uniref:Uncharacterized protein n=1 Tax=Coccomyxa subellipsoidea (strain C-169) TaxID=574566 RepID=I0YL09_COCSC|nr:hypothetical protein COCSUDRAFT_59565 [Coccomyxa subellipsoidea C-169]EIE19078.1 hypothetical protein COCSUDRAFT_59565 [Coccomyxa subellipsoidea C-169]|eukprot:XP_005643622.1 hypothetical protein COCSUDRAFT_59565 [Coccomyxa subellipsoidea C-169]
MGGDGPTALQQLRAVMVPFTATIVIPTIIILRYSTRDAAILRGHKYGQAIVRFVGSAVWAAGVSVLFASIASFHKQGKGTLEPWARPKHLVVTGLYVRNSMYLGVFAMLLGEAFIFNNKNLLLMLLIFMAVQAINVPLHEEWVLRKSFGDEFTEYCKNVPRWIPRLHPYTPAKRDE